MSLIHTEGLTKRYGAVVAVDGLTVDVEAGVTGLVGANGAGKSTLLKIFLGLLTATEGSATVLGLDVATEGPEIRERVGYMPEHDCLPPDVSATEFVVHMARMSGLPTTVGARARPPTSSAMSVCTRSGTGRWAATPPACDSGSSSPRRWCTTPAWCCWTSPPTGWIPPAATTCWS